jgi:hypothetical protein
MTAIVAFAAAQIAFIAGDTKRSGLPCPGTKLHIWSDRIVFGQAGNSLYLGQAIGIMQANRAMYGDEVNDLFDAFDAVRPIFHRKALDANAMSPSAADGKLLVAVAGKQPSTGTLWIVDFAATKNIQKVIGPVSAIGIADLDTIAMREWQTVYSSNQNCITKLLGLSGHVALDRWATDCITKVLGPTVDWPIEFLIARPSDCKNRIIVKQRAQTAPSRPEKWFAWP